METDLATRYATVLKKTQGKTLIAVSKDQPIEVIHALYLLGHRDFGENYAQELIAKAGGASVNIRWHFIGHLQTNKVKSIIPHVSCIHSVDSEKLAREIAKRWRECSRTGRLPIFLEVNIDQEKSKSGILEKETPAIAAKIAAFPEIELLGLMCIPSSGYNAFDSFERLRELEKRCRPWTSGKLSMGMSEDFEEAIRAGATHLRIGTAIFGPRLSLLSHYVNSQPMTDSLIGKSLPPLTLDSSSGKPVRFPEDFKGKWSLLYFYPKDDTPGCTKQACSYRDHTADLKKIGLQLFGVSLDDLTSHDAFIQKFNLNFPLLADTEHKLSESLGVYGDQEWKGKVYKGLSRDTFLVDPDGKIREVWRKVNPETTVAETLSAAKKHF